MRRRTFLASAMATGGCSVIPRLPGQKTLSNYTSVVDPEHRRPLVAIPGTLGSRLRLGRDGDFLWGGPTRLSLDPTNSSDARRLALPLGDGSQPLSALTDGVRPDGVLRRANAQILGATVEEKIYDGLVTSLNAGGYEFSRTEEEERARRGENPGSLEFPYDWRRDIVEAARALDKFVERKARQVERVRRERYGTTLAAEKIRFDFVAHSMGCLVTRYWLMYGDQDLPEDGSLPELTWAGAKRAACVIFVAPPNLGSISALESVANGRSFGPLQPNYPPALIGTHVSVYQLMARSRHMRLRRGNLGGPAMGDLYDAALWEENGWGLLDPRQDEMLSWLLPDFATAVERRGVARRYLERALTRAEQFHRAIDRPGTPRATDLFLVVGTGLDTSAVAAADDETNEVEIVGVEEGDGVVLRASALSDERQGGYEGTGPRRPIRYRTVLLLPGEHVTITQNPVFADNLLYWLLDAPRVRAT